MKYVWLVAQFLGLFILELVIFGSLDGQNAIIGALLVIIYLQILSFYQNWVFLNIKKAAALNEELKKLARLIKPDAELYEDSEEDLKLVKTTSNKIIVGSVFTTIACVIALLYLIANL